jgi:periplasmic mercuric ion binding protein
MKNFPHSIIILLLGLSLATLLTACGPSGNASTSFWVRGNCDMCKETIEGAAKATPGVASAVYDLEAHMLQIDYDSTKVTIPQLHAACAGAGYDTKIQTAESEAYADLPKCCKKPADQ